MNCIGHVSLGVRDIKKSKPFYDAVMATLGCRLMYPLEEYKMYGYGDETPDFWISESSDARYSAGTHVAFAAKDRESIHKFYEVALAHGGRDNGKPGPRPEYTDGYYAAFVLDPDGHHLEVMMIETTVAAQKM